MPADAICGYVLQPASKKPFIVSFSGIDGAGKSTQIENLVLYMNSVGMRVRLVTFWDDVATLRNARELAGHTLFGGERGVGTPEKPVRRRDKDVRSWYMLPVRMMLCLFDAMGLATVIGKIKRKPDSDVVVFDRYIYDQTANLEMSNPIARIYARMLLWFVPRPNIAYLLDADPALARARKPEYPLEFLRCNRDSYLAISRIAAMNVIPKGTPDEVRSNILSVLLKNVSSKQYPGLSEALTNR